MVYEVEYNAAGGEARVRTNTAGFMGCFNRIHHIGGLWHPLARLSLARQTQLLRSYRIDQDQPTKLGGKIAPMREQGQILPAAGKLGVLTAGMGAVTTTFIAGLEAVRPGLAKPIGSLTQMGTVRLGERTDNRSPKIGDFVQLANLKGRYAAGGTLSGQRVWGGAERGRLSLKALRESWFRYSNLFSPMPFDLQ